MRKLTDNATNQQNGRDKLGATLISPSGSGGVAALLCKSKLPSTNICIGETSVLNVVTEPFGCGSGYAEGFFVPEMISLHLKSSDRVTIAYSDTFSVSHKCQCNRYGL